MDQRRLKWAPILLLLGVALTQFYFSRTGELSVWKGGGFGMFSSYDDPGNRLLRVTLVTESGERFPAAVSLPRGQDAKLRTMPSRQRLRRVMEQFSTAEWLPIDHDLSRDEELVQRSFSAIYKNVSSGLSAKMAKELGVEMIEVELNRVRFDRSRGTLKLVPVIEETIKWQGQ
ncbi:hypothetical protein IEN85_04750 [Pelagicoccus sp. NFK12]|uniref:Uncharacterized protein n=1 Tax=Pelagicoccus enzymogenes TaxID=2773457 RepID=A0A927F6K1_9BACT|nr:hypothetical protein [Pelagicoccus enzymogenes]MBD5778789.1 hypothetical protein [Pelagicoccus enzymogenes]